MFPNLQKAISEQKLSFSSSSTCGPAPRKSYLGSILCRDPGGGRPIQEGLLSQCASLPWGSAAVLAQSRATQPQNPVEMTDAFLEGYGLI